MRRPVPELGIDVAENDNNAAAPDPQHLPKSSPPDLGVLLVHGIGEQKQGETLNEFAAPIIKWIDQWLGADLRINRLVANLGKHVPTKDFDGVAAFTSGTLRPPVLPLDTPAHATAVIVRRRNQVEIGRQSWLFAESWWSPQTLAPRVSPFLLWLITRGPWILLLHLSQSVGLDFKAMLTEMMAPPVPRPRIPRLEIGWKQLKFLFVTALWLPLSLLVIALWGVISLIALVPIGYVRKRVYDLLLAITGVVGDSYVLINDPIQRVAFANTARQALLWLHQQGCRKIAVVAHSQGAAVARDLLLERGATEVDLFVTFGPGIAKLDALAYQERRAPQHFLWCGAAAPLTLLAVLSFLRLSASSQTGFALWGFPAFAGLLALAAILISWRSTSEALHALKPTMLQRYLMRHYQPRMRWRDFFASHDPVSNGSLAATIGAGLRRIVSRPVTVLASWLNDHTSYWVSRADFVPRVVQALDRCAGGHLFATATGVGRLRAARRQYRRCVRFLSALRWGDVATLAIPLLVFERVQSAGLELMSALLQLPIDSVRGIAEGVHKAAGWAGSALAASQAAGERAAAVLLVAVAAVLVLHVWRRIVAYWWSHMAEHCLTPVFSPSSWWPSRIKQALLALLVGALGVLPLILSAAWTFAPGHITWKNLDEFLGLFASLVAMLGYAGLVVALLWMTKEFVDQLRAAYRQGGSAWRALRSVPDLWVLPFSWALYGAGGGTLLTLNRHTALLLPGVAVLVAAAGAVFALYRLRRRP
jgi:hypothetical protein